MLRSPRLPSFVAAVAFLAVISCSSGSSDPSPHEYGSATIEPSTVTQGGSITVTPAAAVQSFCATLAVVRSADGAHEPVIQLFWDGWVSYATTQPTWPPCLPPPSSASQVFPIATDFPEGTYLVCLTPDLTEDGCGTMTVVAP